MNRWPTSTDQGGVALALLRAADAMNDALLSHLTAQGWPALNRSESLVFAHIDFEGTSRAELARRIGITKQSMQAIVTTMIASGLLEVRPHPHDGRASLVGLSAYGRRMAGAAKACLVAQERAVENRVGAARMASLRDALAIDWVHAVNPD
jgi:DNA-binding MarR family transcriptional regulator